MSEESEFEDAYQEAIKNDMANINASMNRLIDSVSRFKAAQSLENLDSNDFAKMLADLDFAKFVVSGVMYLHGMPICGHDDHDDEEDEEDAE